MSTSLECYPGSHKQAASASAPPLRLLFWETTTGCNLACIHCRRLEVSEELSRLDLSTEQSIAMIRSLPETGRPILVFSGGEPLKRPDIFELAEAATAVGLPTALATNGTLVDAAVAAKIVAIAEAKTIGYEALGYAGLITVFVKAILCNWMVCLAIVAAMSTSSTIGKIACAYMPVFIFFAQGFEHSVVNMFIIPTGMMMGAKVTVAQWWVWNQIPVTLGNLVGGFVFTGLALYITHKPRIAAPAPLTAPTRVPAE